MEDIPDCRRESFAATSGHLYSGTWAMIEEQGKLLDARLEALERKCREVTGKSLDEWEGRELDWEEAERNA